MTTVPPGFSLPLSLRIDSSDRRARLPRTAQGIYFCAATIYTSGLAERRCVRLESMLRYEFSASLIVLALLNFCVTSHAPNRRCGFASGHAVSVGQPLPGCASRVVKKTV